MNTSSSVLRLTGLDELSACRRQVLDRLVGAAVDDDQSLDVQIAVSELVTNALTHGSARDVEVTVDVTADEVILIVGHQDRSMIPDPNLARLPESTDLSGRGLAIVHSLASTITSTMSGEQSRTVVCFARN